MESGPSASALVGSYHSPMCGSIMIEGESGLLNVFGLHPRDRYGCQATRELRFHTGALRYYGYSSENPEQLRGPSNDTAVGG